MHHWELLFFFMIIAFVYASVGFGGGSSYLAVLAMYELPFMELRLIALICNIIVVSGGVVVYARNNHLDWKTIIPLVLLSVPMAYLGALVRISQDVFFVILGCSLIVAALLLWRQKNDPVPGTGAGAAGRSPFKSAAAGGVIGFLSGLVGIGGGIFLSPVLNLMKWDTPRKIAAIASLFILVNSISGIAGTFARPPGNPDYTRMALLSLAVLAGGQLGSRMAIRFNPLVIRRLTAVLVLVAGIEVLYKHLSGI